MTTIRIVLFLLGCALMAISLVMAAFPPPPERFNRGWVFDLGLLLAVAAHGWPDSLR